MRRIAAYVNGRMRQLPAFLASVAPEPPICPCRSIPLSDERRSITMAVEGSVTEIPDSEDEPMTSSPAVIADIVDVVQSTSQNAPQDAERVHDASSDESSNITSKSDEHFMGGQNLDLRVTDVTKDNHTANSQPDNASPQYDPPTSIATQTASNMRQTADSGPTRIESTALSISQEPTQPAHSAHETSLQRIEPGSLLNDDPAERPTFIEKCRSEARSQRTAPDITETMVVQVSGSSEEKLEQANGATAYVSKEKKIPDQDLSASNAPSLASTAEIQAFRSPVIETSPAIGVIASGSPLVSKQDDNSSNRMEVDNIPNVLRLKESNLRVGSPDLPKALESKSKLKSLAESTSSVKLSSPTKHSQEATLAELKAQRTALLASLATLPYIQAHFTENDSASISSRASDAELTDAEVIGAANKIVKNHIKLLHEYNEIKDIGQGLIGLIADQRGVRIVEVQEEFGIGSTD